MKAYFPYRVPNDVLDGAVLPYYDTKLHRYVVGHSDLEPVYFLDVNRIKDIFGNSDIIGFVCENGCEFYLEKVGSTVYLYLKDKLIYNIREEFEDFVRWLIFKGCGR
jgi:hypothetical protein